MPFSPYGMEDTKAKSPAQGDTAGSELRFYPMQSLQNPHS